MKLMNILKEEGVLSTLQSTNKTEVLKELSSHLISVYKIKEGGAALAQVLESREELGSTGIGDGIAIPHGKVSSIDDELLIVGRSAGGIDFNSIDGQPVYLFFLLVGSENSPGLHLKALARLSRLLNSSDLRKRLMKAKTNKEIYSIITEEDSRFS